VVILMGDDLGYGELGAFGARAIATPRLDALAAQGARFTRAYAGYTVCAPSRTALMTGRHSGSFLKANLSGTDIAPGEAVTLAEVLEGAGYATAVYGKSAPLKTPEGSGFDAFLGQVDQTACHNMYPSAIDDGVAGEGGVPLPLNAAGNRSREECMAHPERYNYTVDVFTQGALGWLDAHVSPHGADRSPFFLYLSLTVPHAGGWTDKGAEQGSPVPTDFQYASRSDWPEVERDHAAAVTYMDAAFGAVLDRLDALGVAKNTLVLAASDNGAHLEGGHSVTFFNSTGGLRGHKRSMYEGGVRSPTIVRWPGVVSPGSVSAFPWAFWDLLPTLAEVAGNTKSVPGDVDGISILPTLRGMPQRRAEQDFLFFTGNTDWADAPTSAAGLPQEVKGGAVTDGAPVVTAYSVVVGELKAVAKECANQPSTQDKLQIFNISADPFETHDLAATPEGAAHAQAILELVVPRNLSCACYQCGISWRDFEMHAESAPMKQP
jgi:arylsulfatase A-like enzyme